MMKLAMHLVLAFALSALTLSSVASATPIRAPGRSLARAATTRLYAKDDDDKSDDKKDAAKKKKSDKGKKEKAGDPAPSGGW
jgi:hypothetical protein